MEGEGTPTPWWSIVSSPSEVLMHFELERTHVVTKIGIFNTFVIVTHKSSLLAVDQQSTVKD